MLFKAISARVQVNGETVNSIVDGMGTFKVKALKILEENNIKDPKPGQWYTQQDWLNAFRVISETLGPNTLFGIGQKIPQNAKFPPQIDSIEKALASIDVAYHMNHRGGEIGTYAYRGVSEREARLVCTNPYPCDFDRGIIDSMAKRFKPKASVVTIVSHETGPCRKAGADSCIYKVTW